ncbi:MAG: hypothetical protein DCC75_11725 [Proteobacteria bacterium]|nr:MAG: hypothetical protein DCC75_11725 [Pseudomonadota bacterium]
MRPNKQFLAILILGLAATVGNVSHSDQRIKVGFPAALTGDASSAGIDQKNAAIIANRLLADSREE